MTVPRVADHATPLQPGAEAPDFELPSTPDQNVVARPSSGASR